VRGGTDRGKCGVKRNADVSLDYGDFRRFAKVAQASSLPAVIGDGAPGARLSERVADRL